MELSFSYPQPHFRSRTGERRSLTSPSLPGAGDATLVKSGAGNPLSVIRGLT